MKERLGIILTDCGEKILQRREKVRFIRMNGEINKLIYEKVLYFYKEGKYVVYITGNGILKERITLEDAYEKTGGYPFLKVERGFVVNTNYMVKMSETTIFMSDGSEIPVSRRLLPKIRREIMINRSRIC